MIACSTDTSRTMVRKFFAGRERNFQLRLGEIQELERNCGAGIGEIMARLATHRFGVNDIWEPVRLGLIGAGANAVEADATVMTYHPPHYPIAEFLALAVEIVQGAMKGVPEQSKKQGASKDSPKATPGDLSVFFRAGIVAGMMPDDIKKMTLAEYHAALDGFIAANSTADQAPTEDEFMKVLAEEMAAGRA